MTDNCIRHKTRLLISSAFIYILLLCIAVVCAGPFLWFLDTSFKTGQNIYTIRLFYGRPTLANYIGVVKFLFLPRYFFNSILLTVSAIVLDIVLASLCAYPLACMDFPGKNFIFAALVSTMILPAAAGLVIKYLTVTKMHLINTFMGVVISNSLTVFSIILLRQSYLSIPHELLDAARIDGASDLKIWAKIMLPEIRPAVSTIAILDFINRWNDFLWPILILQDPKKYPLATALQYLNGQFDYKFGYIAAGTIISVIPVILVFLAFQRNYVEAITGAIKG